MSVWVKVSTVEVKRSHLIVEVALPIQMDGEQPHMDGEGDSFPRSSFGIEGTVSSPTRSLVILKSY